jgi:transposase InsO family protein
VLSLRQEFGWGGKKLQVLLEREEIALGVGTINRIISRNGLVLPKNAHAPALKRFEREASNQLWQMDFKGQFPLRTGFCFPLSLLDDHSRFALGLFALPGYSIELTLPCLVQTFTEYGLPDAMLMDHGQPWYSMSNGYGLTALAIHLIKQGIDLHHGRIAHPQTQGKVERFHRTLKDEMSRQGGWPQDLASCSGAFASFLQVYNQVRPHEALEMKTPTACYQKSQRPYDPHPAEWVYPSTALVRQVDRLGMIGHEGHRFFVCEALIGERVGIEQVGHSLLVGYRHMYVRDINLETKRSSPLVLPIKRFSH